MRPSTLRLFHRLPYSARCVLAAARGLWLENWRYGPETEGLVEAARERETWTEAQWVAHREMELPRVLHTAATHVPYYRGQWSQRKTTSTTTPWDDLSRWPVLQKEAVRKEPRSFISEGYKNRKLYAEHTSGSTGTPVSLWFDRSALKQWYALLEGRLRRWNGVDHDSRWAILGGQLVAPSGASRPPYWLWNRPMRQLYLSAYHIRKETVAAYVEAIRRHEVRYLLGYPSAMAALAKEALDSGARPLDLEVVLSNAEPLLGHQRRVLEEFFGAPVRDTYGMAEMVAGGSECIDGKLHAWPEVGLVETLSLDDTVEAQAAGRIVATGLLNRAMPLVRYEVGDLAVPPTKPQRCTCGRHLPVFRSIMGRLDDLIVSRSGLTIGRLDPVFKQDLPVVEAQIAQVSIDEIRIRVVPAKGFSPSHGEQLVGAVRDRVGDEFDVAIDIVESIERSAAGKFRAVVSDLEPSPTPGFES